MNRTKLDYLVASSTIILCTLFTFIYNIYVRRYVQPYEYGIYTSANMLLLYLNYIQFGAMNSYNRDYPQLLGAMNYSEARLRRNVVFTFLLIIYGVAFFAFTLFFCYLMASKQMEYKLGIGFLANSFFALLTALYNFIDNSLKSEKKFQHSSFIQIIKTCALIISGFFAVRAYGYFGLLIATAISLSFTLLLNFHFFSKLKFSINMKMLINMIRYGLPLLVNGLVWTVMMSVDKFVILFFMTMEDLGVYSVALLGFSTLMLIPQSISQIFYIKMSQIYGAINSKEILINCAKRYTFYLAIIASFVSIGAYYLLPIFIEYAMPSYADSVKSAQVLIIGVGLYSTTLLFSNIFSVLRLNIKLLTSTIILCVLNVIMSSGFVLFLGRNIESVAYGTSISYALYAISLVILLSKTLKASLWELLLNSLLPVSITVLLIIVISSLIINPFIALILTLFLETTIICLIYTNNILEILRNLRRITTNENKV